MAWRESAVFGKIMAERSLWLGEGPERKQVKFQRLLEEGTYCLFNQAPVCVKKDGAGAATGTGGDENVLMGGPDMFEYHILGTQTIVSPVQVANGLNIGMDQTDNDGVEISQGILAGSKHAFTVRTNKNFDLRAKVNIADVSGSDECAVGFRKAEAYQANVDDYDEAAFLNVIAGAIKSETILNNAGTTTTDTTDTVADGVDVTLEVRVDHLGAVTYRIDDAVPTVVAAFSFDSGEVVVPFLYFLHAAGIGGVILLKEWECGYLSAK